MALSEFELDRMSTRRSLSRGGYHDARRSNDLEAMRMIEIAVAQGVYRWIKRQNEGPAYDYWLISFGVHWEDPLEWHALKYRLWDEMGAYEWLQRLDASLPDHSLWGAVMVRVYWKLFKKTFDLPLEQRESS